MRFDDVRASFLEFVKHKNLLGLDVAQYNPDKDPGGSGAKKLVDLLVEALSARLEALAAAATESATVRKKSPLLERPRSPSAPFRITRIQCAV